MNNETQRRIKAYKAALPELRERVIAVALLLAMSASMLATASYAWITLSTAPEVSGMATTVAANGNLEIALAQGSVKEQALAPGESQVGDAASQQGIVKSNVTWGNLVNVSDPTYGLSHIALRPALLSDYNRTEYPLNGASYGGDGRVVSTYDRYEYASYSKIEGSDQYYFAAGDKVNYGVRAISSVGYSNITGNVMIDNYSNTTVQYYRSAQSKYKRIVSGGKDALVLDEASGVTCISALEGLVTVFAQDKINAMGYGPSGATNTSCSPYLWYVYQMMLLLDEVLVEEGNALLTMANWQAYVASGDDAITTTFATIDDLLGASSATLKGKGVTLTTLDNYKSNLTGLRQCITELYPMAKNCENPEAPLQEYYWDDIDEIVNRLVHINSATINGRRLDTINGVSAAMDVLGGGDVIVYQGILKDIEQRAISNESRVQTAVKVKVRTSIPLFKNPTVNGTVYTSAFGSTPTYSADISYSDGLQSSAKGDATAKDTYGLAIDLWVRTNYPDAVLTLEGSVVYEEQEAFGVDGEGNAVDLYTITMGEVQADVYQKEGVWYYSNGHSEVAEEEMGDQTPTRKKIQVITGYQGENRIWEEWEDMLEAGLIEKDTTTQGAGSCFVFYADTPAEQAKIMEMLEAFNVVFIDQNGELLGTAALSTESAYSNQGKVTVPLEMVTGTTYTDEVTTKDAVGITTLEQNQPTWITAIAYLNGTQLQNENVLADGELQGQLNIQFGTNATLVAPRDEDLQSQYRTITAAVTVNGQTTTNKQITLPYNPSGYPATVTLTIDGEQPEHIKGFFVRVINASQGTRGDEITFTKNEDGTWNAPITLTNPGSYIFNTLLVDGVQYDLHDGSDGEYEENHPRIYIEGLKLESVTTNEKPGTYMIADSSKPIVVTAKIDAAVTPKQVNAQFFSADNSKQFTALMTYDAPNSQWVGTANINSSGTYTLRYISVDGQVLEVPAQSQNTYILYLGLTARVSTTVPEADRTYIYMGDPKQMTMRVRVFDDTGTPIENLSGVRLHYNNIISPADMTWDTSGYYEGVLDATQPGFLTFQKLELGSAGTLYNVRSSPTFTAVSLKLPTYVSATANDKQTVIQNNLNATMVVQLEDAQTANVWAELTKAVNGQTETRMVLGTHDVSVANKITFTLPKEDGVWTLNRLLFQNVYDNATNRWYGAEEPVTADNSYVISEVKKISTDVVATITTKLLYDTAGDGITSADEKTSSFTVDFGSSSTAFMTNHTSNTLNVQVSDYAGRKIDGVNAVKWTITHDAGTMKDYGGYTGTGESKNTVAMALKSGSDIMYEAAAQTFRVAGKYSSVVVVDMGDVTTENQTDTADITLDAKPNFTVRSKAPSVVISDITMDGSGAYSVDLNTSGSLADSSTYTTNSSGCITDYIYTCTTNANHIYAANNTQYISKIENEGKTAHLYFKCNHEDVATYSGGTKNGNTGADFKGHTYSYNGGEGVPKATLTLSGIGNATKAVLEFAKTGGGDVVMITQYTADRSGGTYWGDFSTYGTSSYEWTQDGACYRFIGVMDNGAGSNKSDTKTVAGELKASTLVMTYNGKEYSFTIPTITINNPY